MDEILTEFLAQTHADAALAHDLLEATEWNLDSALAMYDGFMNTQAVQPEDQISPEMYSKPNTTEQSYQDALIEERNGEDEEENDTLTVLEGSFETRRDLLRHKRDDRSARGLSFLADDIVDRFHKVAVSKHRVSSQEQTVIDDQFFRHSFVYPDFSSLNEGLQEFIAADLIDISLRNSLEKNNRLNWWTHTGKFPRLEPLATSGDGNCLLHAASLYMWGFHDRFLILRTSMHRLLTESRERVGIQSRWRYQTQLRNDEAGGLTFSEEEWSFEWSEVVRIATNRPRTDAAVQQRKSSLRLSYEYLEEIHIFALAHVTQRPIIVIADTTLKAVSGEDLAPIYFGGVYLPLEMNPTACHKSPVVLAYDAAHFSALVAKEEKPKTHTGPALKFTKVFQGRSDRKREEPVIPLVGPDGQLLPIQFVYNPDNPTVNEKWGKMKYTSGEFPPELIRLLESYLNIRWVKLPIFKPTSQSTADPATTEDYDHLPPEQTLRCPAAQLVQESQPVYQKDLIDKYLGNVQERYDEELKRCERIATEREKRLQLEEEARLRQPVPCKGLNCEMFGTLITESLCSVCYQKRYDDDSEIDKVDLALEGRELDSETVEFYIPQIEEERPPSYTKAIADRWEGIREVDGESGDGVQDNIDTANTLGNTDLSHRHGVTAPFKRSPSPQTPTINTITNSDGSQPDTLGTTSSSTTSLHSTASEGSKGGDKSVKKPKGGWMKKLQALPAGLRPGPKQKKPPTGRDNIQPTSFSRTPSDPTSSLSTRAEFQCRNIECQFYRAPNCDGYCSTCHRALKTIQTTIV